MLAHLAVEVDLAADTRLDEPVGKDKVGVELETGVVKNEVDAAALEVDNELRELIEVVAENVLLGGSKVVTTSRLKGLDVVLGHVNEQRQVGRVAPQTDYMSAPAHKAQGVW